jgi:hypothetical protein
LFIPDPDPDFFTHPASRGQKGTGSRIRIRNTAKQKKKSSICNPENPDPPRTIIKPFQIQSKTAVCKLNNCQCASAFSLVRGVLVGAVSVRVLLLNKVFGSTVLLSEYVFVVILFPVDNYFTSR